MHYDFMRINTTKAIDCKYIKYDLTFNGLNQNTLTDRGL